MKDNLRTINREETINLVIVINDLVTLFYSEYPSSFVNQVCYQLSSLYLPLYSLSGSKIASLSECEII